MKSLDKETALKIDKLTKDMSYLLGYKVKWQYYRKSDRIWFIKSRQAICWTSPTAINSNVNKYDDLLMVYVRYMEKD